MSDVLPRVQYDDAGKLVTVFELPPSGRPDLASVLALALPKSGSVLLHHLLKDACEHTGLTYVSVMEAYFRLGIPDTAVPPETERIFLDHGYCFGGFRNLPPQLNIPLIGRNRTAFLVRDPRDMVVSHYYSSAFSHPERGSALNTSKPGVANRDMAMKSGIDEYAIRIARGYKSMFERYRARLSSCHGVAIYRYEDIIYRKLEWLNDLVTHFGWTELSSDALKAIVLRHDVFPHSEDTRNHIRSVHPGGYRRKLKAATITCLNEIFELELGEFGYHDARESPGIRWSAWGTRADGDTAS